MCKTTTSSPWSLWQSNTTQWPDKALGTRLMLQENFTLVTSSLKACIKAWQLSGCFWRRTVNGGSIFADDTELKKIYILSSHQVHFIMLVQKHKRTLHCFDKKPLRSVFTRKNTSEAMYRPTKWSVEDFQRYPVETCS